MQSIENKNIIPNTKEQEELFKLMGDVLIDIDDSVIIDTLNNTFEEQLLQELENNIKKEDVDLIKMLKDTVINSLGVPYKLINVDDSELRKAIALVDMAMSRKIDRMFSVVKTPYINTSIQSEEIK